MSRKSKLILEVSDDKNDDEVVAYLMLPDHPGESLRTAKNVRLRDLIGDYRGPDLFFDFDAEGVLVGVEILD